MHDQINDATKELVRMQDQHKREVDDATASTGIERDKCEVLIRYLRKICKTGSMFA